MNCSDIHKNLVAIGLEWRNVVDLREFLAILIRFTWWLFQSFQDFARVVICDFSSTSLLDLTLFFVFCIFFSLLAGACTVLYFSFQPCSSCYSSSRDKCEQLVSSADYYIYRLQHQDRKLLLLWLSATTVWQLSRPGCNVGQTATSLVEIKRVLPRTVSFHKLYVVPIFVLVI